jgi:hypothetical protein
MQAVFQADPVLLKELQLYARERRFLTMTLQYLTVDNVPVLSGTTVLVSMLAPGKTKSIDLQTEITHSNIKVNHEILDEVFEVQ